MSAPHYYANESLGKSDRLTWEGLKGAISLDQVEHLLLATEYYNKRLDVNVTLLGQ